MRYSTRGIRRRGNSDKWEVILTHKDPLTGELLPTYHTVKAATEKQAKKKRDELIVRLELEGGAVGTSVTIREFMGAYLDVREKDGTLEPSTVRGYRADAKQILKYIGDVQLGELSIPDISGWMASMTADGYAPKTCSKAFRLLKMALNWARAQDLITKNPCDFCKPPKRDKTPINALNKNERSRMLALARKAQPAPLGIAVELALTTGMRRGEVCGLRWSDLNDDGTITVSHALGNGQGGFYLKVPKTGSSARTIPLTGSIYGLLASMKKAAVQRAVEFGVPFGDPYILGTQETESRPYNPTQLGKDFSAFCKMNGFTCTFHGWSVKKSPQWGDFSDKARAKSECLHRQYTKCATPSLP